jgi:hypothetical protein
MGIEKYDTITIKNLFPLWELAFVKIVTAGDWMEVTAALGVLSTSGSNLQLNGRCAVYVRWCWWINYSLVCICVYKPWTSSVIFLFYMGVKLGLNFEERIRYVENNMGTEENYIMNLY